MIKLVLIQWFTIQRQRIAITLDINKKMLIFYWNLIIKNYLSILIFFQFEKLLKLISDYYQSILSHYRTEQPIHVAFAENHNRFRSEMYPRAKLIAVIIHANVSPDFSPLPRILHSSDSYVGHSSDWFFFLFLHLLAFPAKEPSYVAVGQILVHPCSRDVINAVFVYRLRSHHLIAIS